MTRLAAIVAALAGALLAASACASAPGPVAIKSPTGKILAVTDDPALGRAFKHGKRKETIQTILPQNVRVIVADDGKAVRSASGVSVASEVTAEGVVSYILTNAHVVTKEGLKDPNFLVLIETPVGDTQEFAANVVAEGAVPDADLAVLEVHGVRIEPAVLADDADLVVGDDVVVVAAPYGRPLSVSGGMVSQVDFAKGMPRTPSMIKTDAAIGYGASGGGMYSVDSGHLMGIIEGYRTAKVTIPVAAESYSFDVPMPGETFVAPAAKIRKFLGSKGLARIASVSNGQAALTE